MTQPAQIEEFYSHSVADLQHIAAWLVARPEPVILFRGELGAGKTTLVTELCRQLGCADEISSPTFSLVNEYRDTNDDPVYHIDLYRLSSTEEALHIGIEDYIHSGFRCFIEWPEDVSALTDPAMTLQITIFPEPNGQRRILILK